MITPLSGISDISGIYTTDSPFSFKSVAILEAVFSVPPSTIQVSPEDCIACKSSSNSAMLPPHTDNCLAVIFSNVRTGTS